MKGLIAAVLIALALPTAAAERDYQDPWCFQHKGETEVVMADRSRVDCLTGTHAIEFDFGSKWAEAIGQSLGYAFETGKRAGIVIIARDSREYTKWIKLNSVIDYNKLPIDTWLIKAY
ncbi:MAG: hypothetical protein OQK12_05865 [Motiliproteus sp.]|nr:hypothetical protein [Motiliproteus sp.]MCW9051278.1 hypothetical protein [Motiliproteus sp.]